MILTLCTDTDNMFLFIWSLEMVLTLCTDTDNTFLFIWSLGIILKSH